MPVSDNYALIKLLKTKEIIIKNGSVKKDQILLREKPAMPQKKINGTGKISIFI